MTYLIAMTCKISGGLVVGKASGSVNAASSVLALQSDGRCCAIIRTKTTAALAAAALKRLSIYYTHMHTLI